MTCCDPGPGRIAPRELCSCGSWDVEGWWLALADGHRCLRCGRMWSTEGWELEARDFWMAFLPAVGAAQFLSPTARAAGGAAQDLALIEIDHRRGNISAVILIFAALLSCVLPLGVSSAAHAQPVQDAASCVAGTLIAEGIEGEHPALRIMRDHSIPILLEDANWDQDAVDVLVAQTTVVERPRLSQESGQAWSRRVVDACSRAMRGR